MMPPLGLLMGGADFSNVFATLKEGATPGPYASLAAAKAAGAVTLNVRRVPEHAHRLLILVGLWQLFLMVRAINVARQSAPEVPAPASAHARRRGAAARGIRDPV